MELNDFLPLLNSSSKSNDFWWEETWWKRLTFFRGWSYTETGSFRHKGGVTPDCRNLYDRLLEGDIEGGVSKHRCVLIKTLKRQHWVDAIEERMIRKKHGRGSWKVTKT